MSIRFSGKYIPVVFSIAWYTVLFQHLYMCKITGGMYFVSGFNRRYQACFVRMLGSNAIFKCLSTWAIFHVLFSQLFWAATAPRFSGEYDSSNCLCKNWTWSYSRRWMRCFRFRLPRQVRPLGIISYASVVKQIRWEWNVKNVLGTPQTRAVNIASAREASLTLNPLPCGVR